MWLDWRTIKRRAAVWSVAIIRFTEQVHFIIAVNAIIEIITDGFFVNAIASATASKWMLRAALIWLTNVLVLPTWTIAITIANEWSRNATLVTRTMKFCWSVNLSMPPSHFLTKWCNAYLLAAFGWSTANEFVGTVKAVVVFITNFNSVHARPIVTLKLIWLAYCWEAQFFSLIRRIYTIGDSIANFISTHRLSRLTRKIRSSHRWTIQKAWKKNENDYKHCCDLLSCNVNTLSLK